MRSIVFPRLTHIVIRRLVVAGLSLSLGVLTGCGKLRQKIECLEVKGCVRVEAYADAKWPCYQPPRSGAALLQRVKTTSYAKGPIVVDLERRTIHHGQRDASGNPIPDTLEMIPGLVVPHISTGNMLPLGCRFREISNNELWDEFRYRVVSACYESECPKTTPPLPKPKTPVLDCTAECTSQSDNCLIEDFSGPVNRPIGTALNTLSRLATQSPPFAVSMTDFNRAIKLADYDCERDSIRVDRTGRVEWGGSTCAVAFTVAQNYHSISEITVVLPSDIVATLTQPNAAVLTFSDTVRRPLIQAEYSDPLDKPTEAGVSNLFITAGSIVVQPEAGACLMLKYPMEPGAR